MGSPSSTVDFDSTKMNLFLPLFLCLVASISGLIVEQGTRVNVVFADEGSGMGGITAGVGNGLSSGCEGSFEMILPDNESPQLFKIAQRPGEYEYRKNISEIALTARIPGMRHARKILVTRGNCCWSFFSRTGYRGDMKSIRNSDAEEWRMPRSLILVDC